MAIAMLISTLGLYGQERKPFALLPNVAANEVSHWCSRDGLVGVTGAWRPNKSDLELLESRLADISVVQSQSASKDTHIGQPSLYYRQYIAVLVGRRKLIYVNGFLDKPPSSWRKRVVNICDTGPTDWGVVYDPANTHFLT